MALLLCPSPFRIRSLIEGSADSRKQRLRAQCGALHRQLLDKKVSMGQGNRESVMLCVGVYSLQLLSHRALQLQGPVTFLSPECGVAELHQPSQRRCHCLRQSCLKGQRGQLPVQRDDILSRRRCKGHEPPHPADGWISRAFTDLQSLLGLPSVMRSRCPWALSSLLSRTRVDVPAWLSFRACDLQGE